MLRKKDTFLVGFALFSLFFGAGNLILPPFLGLNASRDWWLVTIGFIVTGVIIPILGIWAHARLQGTLFDVAKKVSPLFSIIYCYLIYAIAVLLPAPRTAGVTHEIGILPVWDVSSWITSCVYFLLVFIFAINRSKVLGIIGKFLTPTILLILFGLIVMAIFNFPLDFNAKQVYTHALSHGFLEGYQTFDAIAAVVVGGVIIISINFDYKHLAYSQKKKLIARAGVIAGLGLALIYAGLILTGALVQPEFELSIDRTSLLKGISLLTLGKSGSLFLSILVSLACFTTAVGIVTGTADFIRGRFNNSNFAYVLTAGICSLLGILIGQFKVDFIIAVAIPSLMFIYPLTIILILLNSVPEKYGSKLVFRWVVGTTLLFSIPDFLNSLGFTVLSQNTFNWLPLAKYQMGWILPATLTFLAANLYYIKRSLN